MNTVESVGATLRIREQAVFSGMEEPTISCNMKHRLTSSPQYQILPIELDKLTIILISASAFFCWLKSSANATPSFPRASNRAAPISTG